MIQTAGVLIIALFAGMFLGALYFWGLWFTVRRLSETAKPFRLMFVSYTLRVGLILTGLYLVMGGRWERLAAAMVGFLIIREILMQRWGGRKAILQ
jgi:F1F0 ATPase subunit 2